jgi:hypothetical protein
MSERFEAKLPILAPVLGERKCTNMRLLYYLEDDLREKHDIEARCDYLIATKVKPSLSEQVITLPPPSRSVCSGELPIGQVEYLDKPRFPFELKLRDLNRHLGIFGSTGSGKTTLAVNILRQLHAKGIPFLVIDWEKSYRALAAELGDVMFYTLGTEVSPLCLNILHVPPGISKEEYTKSLIDLLAQDFLSGAGSDTMFMEYTDAAFKEFDTPTFNELKALIEKRIDQEKKQRGKLAGRAGLWKETVLRIVSFLSYGASGNVLGTEFHMPIETLLSRPVVLEFGGIKNPRDRKFLIHVILNWLSLWSEHRGIVGDKLTNVMLFEEFHNICLKRSEDNLISALFRECRKYGLGLIAIDQTPSEVPNAVFENMNTKISFSLGTAQDISAMGRAMNLDADQSRYLGMLKTGQAIASVKQSIAEPFVFRSEKVSGLDYISNEELSALLPEIEHPSCSGRVDKKKDTSVLTYSPKGETYPSPQAPALDKCVLQDIAGHPHDGVEARIKRLGLGPRQMKEITDRLVGQRILAPEWIGRRKLFDFTPEGRELAKELSITIKPRESRGGIAHACAIDEIVGRLRRFGFKVEAEHKDLDVAVLQPELCAAIEVETGKSKLYNNIKKLLLSDFKHKIMVALSKDVEIKLKQITKEMPIEVMTFQSFMKMPKEHLSS